MSFINERLPETLGAGLVIGPEWKTEIVPLDNGREVRDAKWLYPRWRASGSMGAFSQVERRELQSWFVAVRGRHGVFRVRDPIDFVAESETIAPAIGTLTPVQLLKTYSIRAAASAAVLIQAPVDGTVVVYRNGAPVSVTVDHLTGLVTPTAPWVAGDYTWSGEFDRWMRFDSDHGRITAIAPRALTVDIELIEVRV